MTAAPPDTPHPPAAPARAPLAQRRWVCAAGWLALAAIAAPTAPTLLYADGHGGGGIPTGRCLVLACWLASLAGTVAIPRGILRPAARALLVTIVWIALLATPPSNERQWAPVAQTLPVVSIDGDLVHVANVRNFRHRADGTADAAWYDATFDVSQIMRGYFVLTEFGGFDGIAHVMASFEFEGDRFVVFSAEIRREVGESYDPIGGLFRQYELMYVIADERDAIALRTNTHQDPTWVFPIQAQRDTTARFFVDMATRAGQLTQHPEWYHTFFNSCASNLAAHYERINNVSLGLDHRVLLPGYSEELVAELGMLGDSVDLDTARDRYRVNDRALADGVSDDFSRAIRR